MRYLALILLLTALMPSKPAEQRYRVDTTRSVIEWTGTKFWGMGRHTGTVQLAEGRFVTEDGLPRQGAFVIDMRTIAVTDMPAWEPVPTERLRRHLASDDFFAVERFPTARLVLTDAQRLGDHAAGLRGCLTLHGRTETISFTAQLSPSSGDTFNAVADVTINRHRWGVDYGGSRLGDDLVDDDIALHVVLVAVAE